MDRQLDHRDRAKKDKIKSYADRKRNAQQFKSFNPGDKVLAKDITRSSKTQPFWRDEIFTTSKVFDASVKITNDNHTFIRHKSHVKPYLQRDIPITVTAKTERKRKNTESEVSVPFFSLSPEIDFESENDIVADDIIQPLDEADAIPNKEEEIELEANSRPKRKASKPGKFADYHLF
jgi:hypothetical protein